MTIRNCTKTFLSLAAVAMVGLVTASANADVISIDFGDPGKGIASGDTVLAGGPGDPINSDGQIFTGQVGAWNAGPHAGPSSAPQSFSTTEGPVFTVNPTGSAQMSVNAATFGANILRNDYFWSDNNVIPWELTGLTANGTYNITFFQGGDPGGASSTVDGVGLGTVDTEGDYDFTGVVASGAGVITGTWDATVNEVGSRQSWAGMQFEVNPIPEPGSFALLTSLALGVLGIPRRRRR